MGTSIFLIAVGAILAFAVDYQTSGVDIHTVGIIVLIVGIIGALLSMLFWSSWGGFHRGAVLEDDAPVVRRRRVYEDVA
jgi:hypothetical protein